MSLTLSDRFLVEVALMRTSVFGGPAGHAVAKYLVCKIGDSEGGYFSQTSEELAVALGYSSRSITKAVRELESRNLFSVVRQPKRPNRYGLGDGLIELVPEERDRMEWGDDVIVQHSNSAVQKLIDRLRGKH